MDVLSSRILLHPADLGRSRQFYREVLGLAVYREFGPQADPRRTGVLSRRRVAGNYRARGQPARRDTQCRSGSRCATCTLSISG